MPNYRVQFAGRGRTKQFNGRDFVSINLLLDEGNGQMVTAEWFTAAETATPEKDSHIEGYLEDGPYGKKFKKSIAAGSGGGGGASRPRMSPAEEARIVRQSAQKAATAYIQALATAGRWTAATLTEVPQIIDFFYRDAMEKRDG